MYPNEPQRSFMSLDLVGGETLGKYRQGKLADGQQYFYEDVGELATLDVHDEKGDKTFFMKIRDQEGVLLVLTEGAGVCYDPDGKLLWVSLVVNAAIVKAEAAREIRLPVGVMEEIKDQVRQGRSWMALMDFTAAARPSLYYSQLEKEPEYAYDLVFDSLNYPIPGTNWSVGATMTADMVGFVIRGHDGVAKTHWYHRYLDRSTLPKPPLIAGLTLPDLAQTYFPGFLKAAE